MALAWGTHLGTLPCVFRATWFAIVMRWLSASWFRPLYVPLWGAHPSSGHYLPQASAKRLRGHWCCPMPTLNFSSAFDAEVSHQRLFLCPVPRAGRPARHLRPHGHQACHRHDAPAPCLGLRVGMAGSAMLRLSTHSAGAAWAPRAQKADRGSSGRDHPRPDDEENHAAQRHPVAWDGNQHPRRTGSCLGRRWPTCRPRTRSKPLSGISGGNPRGNGRGARTCASGGAGKHAKLRG